MDDPQNLDCSWEFNAPQFVDFSTAHEDDDHVDRWFDVDHENGQKETEMENVCNGVDIIENAEEEIEKLEGIPKKETCRLTRSMCLTPVNTKSLLVASDEAITETQEKGENRKLSESLPSNLCKSLSDWKRRTKAKTTQQTEITSKRRSPPQKKEIQESKQKAMKRCNHSLEGDKKNEVEIKKTHRSAGNMENGNIKRTGSFSLSPCTSVKRRISCFTNNFFAFWCW